MSDNVYYSISFPSIPRQMAENIREAAEEIIGKEDISFGVSFGPAISGDDPTPIGDEAAAAVGTDAQLSDTVAPDAEPTATGPIDASAEPTATGPVDADSSTETPEGPTN